MIWTLLECATKSDEYILAHNKKFSHSNGYYSSNMSKLQPRGAHAKSVYFDKTSKDKIKNDIVLLS